MKLSRCLDCGIRFDNDGSRYANCEPCDKKWNAKDCLKRAVVDFREAEKFGATLEDFIALIKGENK